MSNEKEKKTFDGVPSESIRRFPRGPVDYGAVLADLEAKRVVLDRAIESVRAIVAAGALGGSTEDAASPAEGPFGIVATADIPAGAFFGKSIPEAAKLYLSVVKRKQTSHEIAEALKKYGMETQSKNFPKIVHAILDRLRRSPNGGLVKLDRSTWGLAEWYHPSFRTIGAEPKRQAKKRPKAKALKNAKTPEKPEAKAAVESVAVAETVPQKVWNILSKAGVELSSREMAERVGIKDNVATMMLGILVKKGKAEKTAGGKYRAMAA